MKKFDRTKVVFGLIMIVLAQPAMIVTDKTTSLGTTWLMFAGFTFMIWWAIAIWPAVGRWDDVREGAREQRKWETSTRV